MEQLIFGVKALAALVALFVAGFIIYIVFECGMIFGWLPRLGRAVRHFPANLARKIWANASPVNRLPSGEMPPKLRLFRREDLPAEPPEGQGIYSLTKRRMRKRPVRQRYGSDRAG